MQPLRQPGERRAPGALGLAARTAPALGMLSWPFVVVVVTRLGGARVAALTMVALLLPGMVRALRGERGTGRGSLTVALGATALAVPAVVLDDDRFLLAWPVLVSAALLATFLLSLRGGRSIVERFARARNPRLSPEEVAYCRSVTWVWCAFFVGNGTLAAMLALSGWRTLWAVYTGVVAYALMGVLFGAELLVRRARFPRTRGAPR